jgi:alpha-amylase/alpha-mannosidase (GH57 family)
MALARAFRFIEQRGDATIENFASFLAKCPPVNDAVLVSPSSWSCPHGVERWRSNCGCRLTPEIATSQEWRTPLRESLNWLASELHEIYERDGGEIFTRDPWAIRNAYGEVMGGSEAKVFTFIAGSITNRNDGARLERAAELLAMEENALRMFTSCAWFFDDLARIETIQVLKYAAFAIELSGDRTRLEKGFLDRIGDAVSNDPKEGTARDIWRTQVMA